MIGDFEHKGFRWGYSFLMADSRLGLEERLSILYDATEMYLLGESERPVGDPDSFEGRIYTERKYDVLGSFAGQRFDAELETNDG